jgi:hypothetical protein
MPAIIAVTRQRHDGESKGHHIRSFNIVESLSKTSSILGRKIVISEVRYFNFETAFTAFVEQRANALMVGGFSLFTSPRNRDKILDPVAHTG